MDLLFPLLQAIKSNKTRTSSRTNQIVYYNTLKLYHIMKFATTATVIAAALALFNPAEARLRGRHLDTDDELGGVASALMSPTAFKIADIGRRFGPFVGPAKSAMGLDEDDGLGNTYMSNGYRMNSNGRLANPSRSAQIRARDAGALTNREAARMGLQNKRDVDDELGVGSLVGYFTNRL